MSALEGRIILINEIQTFGANGFRKREVVLETNSQYPQKVIIEFIQDKVDILNSYSLGDSVSISYNINGREWINPEGVAKYFNSIQGWRIESLAQEGAGIQSNTQQFEPAPNLSNNEPDDLPF